MINAKNDYTAAAVSNSEVIKSFIAGQPAHAGNLSTDGSILRSYHYYELAVWSSKDFITLRAGELYSKTTKKHMTLLIKALQKQKVDYGESTIDTPREDKLMMFISSRADVDFEMDTARDTGEITEDEYLAVRNEQVREARRTLGYIL